MFWPGSRWTLELVPSHWTRFFLPWNSFGAFAQTIDAAKVFLLLQFASPSHLSNSVSQTHLWLSSQLGNLTWEVLTTIFLLLCLNISHNMSAAVSHNISHNISAAVSHNISHNIYQTISAAMSHNMSHNISAAVSHNIYHTISAAMSHNMSHTIFHNISAAVSHLTRAPSPACPARFCFCCQTSPGQRDGWLMKQSKLFSLDSNVQFRILLES